MRYSPKKFAPPVSDDILDFHGRVDAFGECFDWLDHDTRELVHQAIDLNDTDDIAEFAQVVGANPVTVFRRKRHEAA